jgi:hypothetical protein
MMCVWGGILLVCVLVAMDSFACAYLASLPHAVAYSLDWLVILLLGVVDGRVTCLNRNFLLPQRRRFTPFAVCSF